MRTEEQPRSRIDRFRAEAYARRYKDARSPHRHETALPWQADWGLTATCRETGNAEVIEGVATTRGGAQAVADAINEGGRVMRTNHTDCVLTWLSWLSRCSNGNLPRKHTNQQPRGKRRKAARSEG